ncbi:hypothetical protein ZIOFF_044183 [Zingiber officinale]|uniref:Uncharacterized protein n=1 Tax=Zingiber officinale TaxID=94328 RepID=A0A8J5GBN1_ZINOF|nr:hypothetical protein ZIOFF_044183 [Zingiber officinale]
MRKQTLAPAAMDHLHVPRFLPCDASCPGEYFISTATKRRVEYSLEQEALPWEVGLPLCADAPLLNSLLPSYRASEPTLTCIFFVFGASLIGCWLASPGRLVSEMAISTADALICVTFVSASTCFRADTIAIECCHWTAEGCILNLDGLHAKDGSVALLQEIYIPQ